VSDELARACAGAMAAGDEAARSLGIEVEQVSAGYARARMAVERVRIGRSGVYDVTVRRRADGAVIAEFRGRSRSTGRRILG
jgi:acyl-CoA thioesterase